MRVQPRNNEVLVRMVRSRKESFNEVEVLAVGPGEWSQDGTHRETVDLAVGAHGLVGDMYDANRVEGLKGKCYLVREYDVVAIVQPES